MNPLKAVLDFLDRHLFQKPWPERREATWDTRSDAQIADDEWSAPEARIARLQAERPGLIAKRDRAKKNKKAHLKFQRALEANTTALLKLEGER